ncbi:TPA: hypothetical protein CPT96_05545 [Candidatus Gastranaerophilales bacterium HUM_10]|nr:MAG TPA: hypothetical protein CPT96_05545 [Candidatus Gastranaerophilales bacterium HUM_10]
MSGMKKKIFGLLIALGLAVPAFASVAVAPTRVEINANKLKNNYVTTAIEVKGDSQQPMRFKVYPGFFTINEKGELVMVDNANDPHDLSKKIRFVPSEFTVAQGKSQKVRINIAGLNTLPDGENRTILYIEDVNPKEMSIPTGRAGIGAQLIVKTRVGVPVYVDKGRVSKDADVEYLNIVKGKDGLYTDMKVISKGNSKVRYSGNVQIVQGKKLIDEYSLAGKVVAGNNFCVDRQKIKTDNIKEAGEYTLRMVLSYFDENGKRKNIKKEANLNITGKV